MNYRKMLTISNLLIIPLLIMSTATVSCSNKSEPKKDTPEQTSIEKNTVTHAANSQNINVYYFHTSYRCATCNMIEGLTQEALSETFPKQVKKGTITFKKVDIETDENEHFIDKYKLITKSIIISKAVDNEESEWKNLDKIWSVIKNKEKFKKYIIEEVKKYLST